MILGAKTYTSLAAFQAAGYEKVGRQGRRVLRQPPAWSAAGSAGTSVTTGTNLASYLSAYQLQKTSTVAKAGVNLKSVLGVTLSGTDLYGDAVSAATTTPGADTVASTTTASSSSNPTPSPTPTPTKTPTPTPTATAHQADRRPDRHQRVVGNKTATRSPRPPTAT